MNREENKGIYFYMGERGYGKTNYELTKQNQQLQNQVEKLTGENKDLEERVIHQDNVIRELKGQLELYENGVIYDSRLDKLESVIDKAIDLVEKEISNYGSDKHLDELLEILRSKE